MKISTVLLSLMLMSCASCQIVKDQATSPSVLNQDREVIQVNGLTEVGINGTISPAQPILFRSYGAGTITIRGTEECGFVTSGSTSNTGWISIDPNIFPVLDFCMFSVQEMTNGFDAPAIGHLLIRRFLDPNITPLSIEMNHVIRSGINWVQLRQDGNNALSIPVGGGGIYEGRNITLHFNGTHSGRLNITGCGFSSNVTMYNNVSTFNTTVDYLYRQIGMISKDCLFVITANHNDALAESATILVKSYDHAGSFLAAPVSSVDTWGEECFNFVDPYVVGIGVNGKWSNNNSLCVSKASSYEVEGVTSESRVFYGISDGINWLVMK